MIISIVLTLQIFGSLQCTYRTNEKVVQSWLNAEYIDCLKDSLPCDCQEKVGTYYSLVLDSNVDSKNFGIALSNFDQMEPYLYPIKKITSNELEVLTSRNDVSSWAKVVIYENELQFIEGNTKTRFIQSSSSDVFDIEHYYKDNVRLLNKSFLMKGYPALEDIVKESSLNCDCNKWMGQVNLLSVQGAPHAWVLEIKDDSLYINRVVNEDKDPDDPFETETVASFK